MFRFFLIVVMSSPEIAIHKKRIVMKEHLETLYTKRTQKDYSLSLKLQIVKEIESGEESTHSACRKYGIQARSTIVSWLRKYGNFDWENQTPSNMAKTPEQRIMELEAEVNVLKKQKKFLEKQAYVANKKAFTTRTIDYFRRTEKETLVFTCGLSGIDRQVYYRSIKRSQIRIDKASQVVELVEVIRLKMPKLGGKKLYFMLKEQLNVLKIGRDRFFDILRANHLLIIPKKSYHITTNSHHRFRKHKNLVLDYSITKPNQVWVADITYI